MRRWIPILILLSFLAIVSASPEAAGPTTSPLLGAVQGVVHLQTPAFASQMVIYLAPGEGQSDFASGGSTKISQKGARFWPALSVVHVHQTVDFLNDEDRPIEHNVFSNSPTMPFDLGLFKPGEKRSVTFDKPGPVLLYCSIHRHMDGVIYVTPTPYFDVIDPDGTEKDIQYRIEGVPPGKWVVHTWQRRRRCQEISAGATVKSGESCVVNLQLGAR